MMMVIAGLLILMVLAGLVRWWRRRSLAGAALPANVFHRGIMVTVPGGIPDQAAAVDEIRASPKPGGPLSITKVLPDPHYERAAKVQALPRTVAFQADRNLGNWIGFTANFRKPASLRADTQNTP